MGVAPNSCLMKRASVCVDEYSKLAPAELGENPCRHSFEENLKKRVASIPITRAATRAALSQVRLPDRLHPHQGNLVFEL